MTVTVLPAVDLLERAVGYTRGTLAHVRPGDLSRPTPCVGWDLGRLLAHMDDALAAFTEASAGYVDLRPVDPAGPPLERIRARACALLGASAAAGGPETVGVGDQMLPTDVLLAAGALEITLHGWDVGRATGHPTPVPDDLARTLLPVAGLLISTTDRPRRFARPRPAPPGAGAGERLVGYAGRD